MKVQIRVKRNCPKTYLERVAKGSYMAYLSRDIGEGETDAVILKLVSKEFFSPLHKIFLGNVDAENLTAEIL